MTSTELATLDTSTGEITTTPSPLVQWAIDASEAHRIAQSLAKTSFVPAAMKGKPDEITAAILAGQELGLRPMAALRSINVIQGTPAFPAITLRGLVQAAGHEVWVVESTDTRAVVAGMRAGSDREQRSTWTIDRATKMKLAGKDNWRLQPAAMLVARATSEVCRLIASDLLIGMAYTAEELSDAEPEPPAAPVRRRRKPVPPLPAPEPALDADAEAPSPEPAQDPQGDADEASEDADEDRTDDAADNLDDAPTLPLGG